MNEVYYRVTFEGLGYFSSVHSLIDYLGDTAYDDYDENAAYDISEALCDLERNLYCPDLKQMEAIFAYTKIGYEKFYALIQALSKILVNYGFETLKITELETDKIVYEDVDQIAFIPKKGEWEI